MFEEQDMEFKVTFTQRTTRVEMWICHVKEKYVKCALISYVGMDCEFTDAPRNVKQKKLPYQKRQCATILVICVVYECLVFQIFRADGVPELLREFLRDENIMFCGAAIDCDCFMLQYCDITISSTHGHHHVL
jgi:hypothetical protein